MVCLSDVGLGGLAGLRWSEASESPGDREGESVLTASLLCTITHSSESLEGDVSLLDLGINIRHAVTELYIYFSKSESIDFLRNL